MPKENLAMLNNSRISLTPTDLSRRSEHTGVSVPDDGQEITIHTNRRRRNDDAASTLTAASQTSLLIEYFEKGKRKDGVPSSRPSVRVKVTPSSKRHSKASRDTASSTARASSPKGRRPSITAYKTAPVADAGDRLTLGGDRPDAKNRSRSFSGDISSNLSPEDDDNRYREPEVIVKTKKGRTSSSTKYGDTLSPKIAGRKARSRSTSRDHQDSTNPKLTRRRSRSLSQDRISSKLKEKMDKLGVEYTTKKTKNVDDDPKRKSSRSRTREKKNEAKAINKISENPQYNPALLEAVEDTIKRLILPQLADLKTNQNRANFDKTLAAATAKVHASMLSLEDPNGLKSASMPDISKSTVASPAAEADKSKGQGYMAAGGQATTQGVSRALDHSDSETSYTRAPGLGPTRTRTGESIHSATSDKTEGVLLGPMHDHDQQRLRMPMPSEYAESTYAETRASILTEPEGLPYPTAAQANAMPGQTTPPRSRGNSISSLGDRYGGHKLIREPDSVLSPSTLHPEDPNQRRPGSSSSIESVSHASVRSLQQIQMAQAKPIHVTSPSSLSIPSISDTPSTKVARQRRKGKAREGVHAIGEEDYDDDKEYNPSDLLNSDVAPPAKNSMDWYFSEQQQQQKQAQQQLLQQQLGLQPQRLQVQAQQEQHQQQDRDIGSLQQNNNNNNNNQTHQSKQQTLLNIAAAAGLDRPGKDHQQSRDGSALSAHDDRDLSDMHSEKTNPPFLSPNAIPDHYNPIPDVNGMYPDDDVLTNPSEIGRRRDEMDHDDDRNWDQHHDNQHDDQRSLSDYNHDRDLDHDQDHHHDMHRGLDVDDKMDRGMDGSSAVKDEGYASPGFSSPGPVAMPMPMGGIDDLLDGDDYSLPYQRGTHSRVASGGSHGMASPLYDSSTGRGVDRIQSKDIVALMDHLTVRDAQRNARDTEILITLVRSAAEMRNSFEDLKKQLEQAQNEIVHQVDMNTERSVQKVLVGPRPQPISAPRPKRSLASEAGTPDDEEAGKRKSMFKRALKGLSMRSATDLTRIEGMLERLLDEVEGLKGGGEFYQQSILGTIENLKHSPPNTANNGLDAPSSSTANSGYYTATATGASASNGPSRQASGLKIYEDVRNPHRISTIEEDSATPTPQQQQQAQPQPRSLPDSPVQNFTAKNDKSAKRESNSSSIFPKISRWSETTASSGVRGFLRKEAGNPGHPQDHYLDTNGPQSPGVPPSSRGTDAPVNQATIRTSLEVKHPQPKTVYRHTLEQQAQQFINMDPAYNHSSPSLVRFTSQSDANGIPLSPTSEMYTASNVDSQLPPPRPPKIPEEYEGDESPLPLKERKSKERNKDKTDRKSRDKEDKDKEQRRRERRERKERREKENGGERSHRSSKTKLKDDKEYFESELGRSEIESPSTTTRSMSKLKGPRPLSRNDTNEYKTELENSGTVIRKSRNRSSHMTTDTFGMGGLLD